MTKWLVVVLCVFGTACGAEEHPAVGYQPPTGTSPIAGAEPLIVSGQLLKRVLPRLKRSSRYGWSHHSIIVPGHLGSTLVENIDEGKTEPRHVLTFIINDLLAQPQRLAQFRSLPPLLNKRPGKLDKGHRLSVLVADRFEVMIRAEHPSHTSYDKLKYWHDQMRLSELVMLNKARKP